MTLLNIHNKTCLGFELAKHKSEPEHKIEQVVYILKPFFMTVVRLTVERR
jgi:hypothetical protein